jgi:hypothetical protein
MKYIGVYERRNMTYRKIFSVRFSHNSIKYEFGSYKTAEECARAYDLFVIRKGLDRKTNFFKKKIV